MIQYRTGDATEPVGDGPKLIIHCCNDQGKWGAGFTKALSQRWRIPEIAYRSEMLYLLGEVSFAKVRNDLWVANIIGQHGVGPYGRAIPPIRYEALRLGFRRCVSWLQPDFSVHAPRLGCGLAGGDWKIVDYLLEDTFVKAGFIVTIYDLP